MADDYSINAKITADTSGFEKGVKNAQTASKNLSTSLSKVIQGLGKSGLVGALGAVGLASQGVTATLGAVTKIAKKVSQTIDECSEAYRRQYQAEIALATAVNNNPYVDGTATRRLKDFASEMQRVSDIGDEELLPIMADLIAKGRTEDETMQLVSVALDMSAGGAMSLDTAITQLNATLNGNVGRLGQQNAELKNLTEEELKQGKAVEILGAKYKGLAQATADSQKQLRNAVGDLKENMGKIFEEALAPMRNFFTEVITNLNNSITKSREFKSAMKEVFGEGGEINLASSTDALNTAFSEVLHKQQEVTRNYQQYIQLYGKYIDVATDETALSYSAQIADLNAQLKTISEELNKRRKESEEEKRKLAQAKADEEAQKELEKQKEIRKKELELENEWADKLLAIRIENLEKTRDAELDNDKLTYEEKLQINDYYGDMILAMRIRQIEKEREEALSQENLTDEAREAINLYYENKITQTKQGEADKRKKIKKDETEDEKKAEKKTFAEMVAIAKKYTDMMAKAFKSVSENIKKVFSKIGNIMKSIFSGVKNGLSKLFEFNVSDALDNLLKIEDAILTFFVETLPQLPSFLTSAFNSIIVLIDTLMNIIDIDNVVEMITGIIDSISKVLVEKAPGIVNFVGNLFFTIIEALPSIISNFLKVLGTYISEIGKFITENGERLTTDLVNIVQSVVEGITEFITGGGWKNLLSALLTIQKALETAVVENLPALVDGIIAGLPDLTQFLIDSIVSASKTLGKIAKPIFKAILAIIMAIIELLNDDDVIDQMVETFAEIIEGLIEAIIEMLPHFLTKTAPKVIKMIQRSLTRLPIELGVAFIRGLVNAFIKTDWGKVVRDMFTGFIDSIKDFFGIHSPSTLFESFGEFMIEGLWNGIQNMGSWLSENVGGFFSNLWEGIKNVFSGVGEWFGSVFSGAKEKITSAFEGIGEWFGNVFKGAKDKITSAFEGIGNWASGVWDNIKGGFSNVGSWFSSTFSGAVSAIQNAFSGLGDWFNGLWNNIKSGVASVGDAVNDVVSKAGNWLGDIGEGIWDWGSSVGEGVQDAIEGVGDWFEDVGEGISDWVDSWKWWATGTNNASKGLAVVGEQGPELVRFNGGEQVLNTRNTQKALEGVGKNNGNTFNVTFNNLQDTSAFAMIQQLKQYNRQMAINGII